MTLGLNTVDPDGNWGVPICSLLMLALNVGFFMYFMYVVTPLLYAQYIQPWKKAWRKASPDSGLDSNEGIELQGVQETHNTKAPNLVDHLLHQNMVDMDERSQRTTSYNVTDTSMFMDKDAADHEGARDGIVAVIAI